MKYNWQRDVLETVEHLRKFHKWSLPAEVKRYDRSAVSIGTPGKSFRVFRGDCTWAEPVLAIDASMVRDVATKQAAMLLARTLARGWRCVMVAVGNSMAVFANRRLIGRVPPIRERRENADVPDRGHGRPNMESKDYGRDRN